MPGSPFKVLVTDPIDREGLKPLESHKGIAVEFHVKPAPEKLAGLLDGVSAWLVRSETKVTADWIEKAKALKLIGRAGVGVDNIDLNAASRKGVAVINAPQGNTIAACEHAWALILSLSRNIPQADAQMRAGLWERSKLMGAELQGKTLGVVGLGRIGREMAKRALAFGMQVAAFDPYVSNEQAKALGTLPMPLEELFAASDFITLHVPGSDKTKHLINEENAKRIKKGARLVNCARGGLISESLLVELVQSGQLKGAALDVFEQEPLAKDSPLRSMPQILLTPHLGASTEEAQRKVAEEIARGVIEFFEKGLARYAINLPGFGLDTLEQVGPYLYLSEILGRFLAQTFDSGLREIVCSVQGDFTEAQRHPLAVAALKGVLGVMTDQAMSYINAPIVAKERGIKVSETADPDDSEGFSKLVTVKAITDAGEFTVSGAIVGRNEPRIVRLGTLLVDVQPQGRMIVLTNQDQPGMIGRVGQLLGDHKINIADMRVGRRSPKGEAVMVITVDEDVPENALKELAEVRGITGVRWVRL